jgi:AcrR family transcriptional regulator
LKKMHPDPRTRGSNRQQDPPEDLPHRSAAVPERRSWTRDRAGKEADLVRAFDTVLARAGWEGIGVNAVVQEAGVGGNLLYRYFGGLGGLAKAAGLIRGLPADRVADHRRRPRNTPR